MKGSRPPASDELTNGEVDKKRQKRKAEFSSKHEAKTGLPSTINFQGVDMDSDVDVESEESDYDHIHAGYDIHNPDNVCTLLIITSYSLMIN